MRLTNVLTEGRSAMRLTNVLTERRSATGGGVRIRE